MPNRPQFPLTRPLPPLIFTQHPASLYFHTENILPHLTSARNKPWPSSLSFKILTPLHLHIPHPAPLHARSTAWLTSLPNTTPGATSLSLNALTPTHFRTEHTLTISLSFNNLTPLHFHIPHPDPPHFLSPLWPHFFSICHTLTPFIFIQHLDPTFILDTAHWSTSLSYQHSLRHITPWPTSLQFTTLTPLHFHIQTSDLTQSVSIPRVTLLPHTTPSTTSLFLNTQPHFTSTYHTLNYLTFFQSLQSCFWKLEIALRTWGLPFPHINVVRYYNLYTGLVIVSNWP